MGSPVTIELLQSIQDDLRDRYVEKLEFESELDSAGEPSVWIWIVLRSDAPKEAWTWEHKERLRKTVINELSRNGVTDWPYVSFRSANEAPASATVSST